MDLVETNSLGRLLKFYNAKIVINLPRMGALDVNIRSEVGFYIQKEK